jgi:hypothetical protein
MEQKMPDLSIKNVPVKELERIRTSAKRNRRSLQGELRVIISDAAARGTDAPARRRPTFGEVVAEIRRIGLKTPSESVRMIREDRDGR